MYLDGELTGFARTYHEAENTLDQLVFELQSGQYFQSTTKPTLPSCPSCGDAVREPGACAACKEVDAIADCAAGNEDRIPSELSPEDIYPLAFTCGQCQQTKDEEQFTLSAQANIDATLCNDCFRKADKCLICKQPSTDAVCSTCVEDGARCSEGHALGDDGRCETCDDLDMIAGDVGRRTIVDTGDY
jgi:hypothetical protein